MSQVKTEWELWAYDVWGSETDGYEVNDRSCFNRAYEMNLTVKTYNKGTNGQFNGASPSDNAIRKAFGITVPFETDGDDTHIYITASDDGYPIGEMHCVSHESLSPIVKITDFQFTNA